MDNKKIGKLISDLRKKQGLTQEQLGDKVGVGFRAVSKWERGITLPDITIINELSKILGISSDELLSGELKKEKKNDSNKDNHKNNKLLRITITITLAVILIVSSVFIYYNNKTYTYKLVSAEQDEYYVDGKVYFNKDKISITINEVRFKDEKFESIVIDNYEYEMSVKNKFLFGYGYMETIDYIETPTKIKNFLETFTINYDAKMIMKKEEMLNNNITIKFKFLTAKNEEIEKELNVFLTLEE